MVQVLIFTDITNYRGVARYAGPYRIATGLREAGYSVQVVDFFGQWEQAELIKLAKRYIDHNTLWVGFSSTFFVSRDANKHGRDYPATLFSQSSENMQALYETCRICNPKVKFVCGGASAPLFRDRDIIDFYVVGYADQAAIALSDFLSGKRSDLATQPVPKSNARVIDWKSFPSDNFHNFRIKWHDSDQLFPNEALPIEIGRGCIFRCAFCAFPMNGKRKGTYVKEAAIIREEMQENYDRWGITNYIFTDDTHNDDPEKLVTLKSEVYDRLSFKLSFACYARLDLIHAHPETADILLESGLIGPSFGIETLNPQSAKVIGKGMNPERLIDFLWHLKTDKWKNKINLHGNLMIGLPYDTPEYVNYFAKWAVDPKRNPLDSTNIGAVFITPRQDLRYINLSKFDLEAEKYGYKMLGSKNWQNQYFKYTDLDNLAARLRGQCERLPHTKVASFSMMAMHNCDVPLPLQLTASLTFINRHLSPLQVRDRKIVYYKQRVLEYQHG